MVDRIEKSLPFWVDRMGFEKTGVVPEGENLVFAMLARDGVEIMLQTIESMRKDEPKFVPKGEGDRTILYLEVEDFADILKRLDGYPIEMEERKTFYGMREIGVLEPGGHIVMFAARVAGS